MSMFGFGGGAGGNQAASPAKIAAAEAELDMVTDMFNKLVDSCYTKCIEKSYAEGVVNKGEALCLDRCVAKYFEVNTKVGENMQKIGAASGANGGFMGGRP